MPLRAEGFFEPGGQAGQGVRQPTGGAAQEDESRDAHREQIQQAVPKDQERAIHRRKNKQAQTREQQFGQDMFRSRTQQQLACKGQHDRQHKIAEADRVGEQEFYKWED